MEAYIQEDSGIQIWNSSSTSQLLPLGRVMNTLLSADHRKLEAVLSQLTHSLQRDSRGSLDQSVASLQKHVEETVHRNESLDQLLVPMLEHVVKVKALRNRKQVVILLQWLCQSEEVCVALAYSFKKIIMEREDHRIVLGWCVMVRELVEKGIVTHETFDAGKQHRYAVHLFNVCCHCIPQLLIIVHKTSVQHDGFELPTRLSIAAADCILVFTQALTESNCLPKVVTSRKMEQDQNSKRQLVTPIDTSESSIGGIKDDLPSTSGRGSSSMERERLLWDHLDNLVVLVQQLQMWSKRSRPLHTKGMEQVCKRLQAMAKYRDFLQEDLGTNDSDMKIGAAVLSACWKHYGKLMLLEDRNFSHHVKETFEQFVDALQHYTENDDQEEDPTKNQNMLETRTYFLACLALLLGRLDSGHLGSVLAETGSQFLNLLFAQLRHADEDVTDLAVSILRAIIFRSPTGLSENVQSSFGEMETIIPLLLDLLDERDSAARAVVLLIAEYFSINPDAQGLQDLFTRLDSDNHIHRRNALDVISELMAICSQSGHALAPSLSQNIAKHLLDRLGDEELTNRVHASRLFAQLDPSFVLPALVRFVYSPDGRVRSAASDAIVAVLKGHNDPCSVISVLLDCVRNTFQCAALPKHPGQVGEWLYSDTTTSHSGSRMDIDRIMRLVPKWSIMVQDWDSLVKMLLSKMFAETSNAIIPRFLSQISNHLADVSHIVFRLLISHMLKQQDVSEDILCKWKEGRLGEAEDTRLEDILFDRLSPLLVLKVLPLRAFNDHNSRDLYGDLSITAERHGGKVGKAEDDACITALLIKRMCNLLEFEDVRKLAAELTGRLHPYVMLPLISSQLEHATLTGDILKLKACLFAICTSLMIRGKESSLHPVMVDVRHFLATVLLWPCSDSDEVAKAQHGCIDCLAFMICSELQCSDSSVGSSENKADMLQKKPSLIEEIVDQPEHAPLQINTGQTVISSVIRTLTSQKQTLPFIKSDQLVFLQACPSTIQVQKERHSNIIGDGKETSIPISFRLCMANVLISVCQKISVTGKSLFSRMALPALIEFLQVTHDSQMRAACLQVLFTSVYHLKCAVLPYVNELLSLSIQALRTKGLVEERIAGAKLMASLLASEESIVNSIAPSLMDAKTVLTNIAFMDTSSELRSLSEKLLQCMSIPLEDISSKPKFNNV
eukprot:Gb_14493 [translate_table: standard]